ncbi:hypothetical protein [Legionella tunisiensis]|uniref:hypothetical protein n=1 Tax=Legionella tunisiensis TaxID=1034944 RepID=UPI0003096E00|nr:hypothetical protein [Legionella tunisiensis]
MTFAKIELDQIESGTAINIVCSTVGLTGIAPDKKAEEKVMQLIEKISSDIYTQCLDKHETNIDEIRQKVAEIVARKAKDQNILPQEFDFQSAYNLQVIGRVTASLKTLNKTKIVPKETIMPHENAIHFYESYHLKLMKAIGNYNTLKTRLEKEKSTKIQANIRKFNRKLKFIKTLLLLLKQLTHLIAFE